MVPWKIKVLRGSLVRKVPSVCLRRATSVSGPLGTCLGGQAEAEAGSGVLRLAELSGPALEAQRLGSRPHCAGRQAASPAELPKWGPSGHLPPGPVQGRSWVSSAQCRGALRSALGECLPQPVALLSSLRACVSRVPSLRVGWLYV